MSSEKEGQHLYGVVVNEYSTSTDDHLTLMQGEIVKIFKQDGKWAHGSLYGKTGWFPVACVDFLWGWQPSARVDDLASLANGGAASSLADLSNASTLSDSTSTSGAVELQLNGKRANSVNAAPTGGNDDAYEELSGCSSKAEGNFHDDHDLIQLDDPKLGKRATVEMVQRGSSAGGQYLEEFKQCCDKLALLCRTETAMIAIDDQNEAAITSIQERIKQCRNQLDELGVSIKKHIPEGQEIMEQFQYEHHKFLEEQEDMRSKILQIRAVEEEEKLIREIIESERKYNRSLHLVIDEVAAPAKDMLSNEEYDSMFSRLEDVALFSSSLLESMEQSSSDVSKPFHDHWEELCEVYSDYAANYDSLVVAYGKLHSHKRRLIEDRYNGVKSTSMYPNVEDFFLCPIQRIMQYPLLLGRFCRIMPAGDPRLEDAERIYALMKGFVLSVDEVQARNRTVYRYLTKEERNWFEKLHHVNWRSLDKKANRALQRVAERFHVASTTMIDRRFEDGAKRFRNAKRRLKMFILTVSKTVAAMQLTGKRCLETTFCVVSRSRRLQDETADCMDQLRSIMETLACEVKQRVTEPSQALLHVIGRSTKLISKRMDKLLDYEHYRTRNEVLAKQILSDYVDLNEQLCRDLPILCERIDSVVEQCFYNFLYHQYRYNQAIQLYYRSIQRFLRQEAAADNGNEADMTRTLDEISRMAICGAFPQFTRLLQ